MPGYPGLTLPLTLEPRTRQELEQVMALIQGYLSIQHNEDGSHTDIVADSLTTSGAVIIEDEEGVQTSLSRTVQNGTRLDIAARADGTNPHIEIRYPFLNNGNFNRVCQIGYLRQPGNNAAPGIRFFPSAPSGFRTFDLQSGAVSAGPALIVADPNNNDRFFCLVWTGSRYEVRPNSATNDVALGNGATGSRFIEAHVVNGYYEHTRAVPLGEWQNVAYASGDYTANGSMTWTVDSGDQEVRRYAMVGTTLHYTFRITATTIGGTPDTELRIKLPGSLTAVQGNAMIGSLAIIDNGAAVAIGSAFTTASANYIRCFLPAFATWAASTNNTSIIGTVTLEVA